MKIFTLTVDDSSADTILTYAYATDAECWEQLRVSYPEHAEQSDGDLLTTLTENGVVLYILDHEVDPYQAGYVAVSFDPVAIDEHFEGDDDPHPSSAAAIWATLTPEQRIDAAESVKGFFESDDGLWERFSDAVIEGIHAYHREQILSD